MYLGLLLDNVTCNNNNNNYVSIFYLFYFFTRIFSTALKQREATAF